MIKIELKYKILSNHLTYCKLIIKLFTKPLIQLYYDPIRRTGRTLEILPCYKKLSKSKIEVWIGTMFWTRERNPVNKNIDEHFEVYNTILTWKVNICCVSKEFSYMERLLLKLLTSHKITINYL